MTRFETVSLQIPCSYRYVTVARRAMESLGSRAALSEEQVADITLAVGEACTNAIKFCNPDSRAVNLLYRLASDRLEVEVRNSGEGFSSDEYEQRTRPLPSADNLKEGGMGIYLMKHLMDEVDISSTEGTTVVRMVKLLNR